MTRDEVQALTPKNLLQSKLNIEDEIKFLKDQLALVEEEIEDRFIDSAAEIMGGPIGTAVIDVDGTKLKIEVTKRVAWDQDLLKDLGRKLPPEIRENILSIKFNVTESTYKNVSDPELKSQLDEARIVSPSKPKFTIG